MKHRSRQAEHQMPPQGVNKWEALRELAAARETFGLSDRDIAVLQALVSFHKATILGGNEDEVIVFPSNKAICERLNGMPCSTMRRHLANIVSSGMVIRRDSPNGKRYVRRGGGEVVAFGFDLSPLASRHSEVCAAAEAVRAEADRLQRLRETVSLMRRDLAGLAAYGGETRPDLAIWDQFSDLARLTAAALRRKLTADDLNELEARLAEALDGARDVLDTFDSKIMSINDALNEQHYQNSNTDSYDLEPRLEKAGATGTVAPVPGIRDASLGGSEDDDEADRKLPNVPLGLVLAACREFLTYSEEPVRHWHELVRAAHTIRPMIGISPSAWNDALAAMGPEVASVVLVSILERFDEIRSPGGYLRSLTARAKDGQFSCGPMVMALMRRDAA